MTRGSRTEKDALIGTSHERDLDCTYKEEHSDFGEDIGLLVAQAEESETYCQRALDPTHRLQ